MNFSEILVDILRLLQPMALCSSKQTHLKLDRDQLLNLFYLICDGGIGVESRDNDRRRVRVGFPSRGIGSDGLARVGHGREEESATPPCKPMPATRPVTPRAITRQTDANTGVWSSLQDTL